MKPINLLSLLSARFDLNDDSFHKYIEQFGINPRIRFSELEDMQSLVQQLFAHTNAYELLHNYYVGFMINQIGKEFDLLRMGDNYVINIELKRASNGEKMLKQLIQNHYYLKFLDVPIYHFTYVSSTKTLYYLTEEQQLIEVDFDVLVEKLNHQTLKVISDLNDLFDPSNYLVSPFNSPAAFIEDKYFLSAQQSTYKREIIQLAPKEESVFVNIKGGPGTGKTLLIYDIAKEYLRQAKKVLIFNCGKLTQGHYTLINQYHWSIEPISHYRLYDSENQFDFSQYELIIFDEAQRLYKPKFLNILQRVRAAKMKCIFSFDPDQCLTKEEIEANVPKLIEQYVNPYTYELTTIFRHNKELNAFIHNLFDLSRKSKLSSQHASLQYFSSIYATKSYLQFLQQKGWKVIDYTKRKYIEKPDNDHFIGFHETENEAANHEFDYVVAVIDDSFYYRASHLAAIIDENERYDPAKMLYQNISRTRKKLHLVIVNNQEILNKVLMIMD